MFIFAFNFLEGKVRGKDNGRVVVQVDHVLALLLPWSPPLPWAHTPSFQLLGWAGVGAGLGLPSHQSVRPQLPSRGRISLVSALLPQGPQ